MKGDVILGKLTKWHTLIKQWLSLLIQCSDMMAYSYMCQRSLACELYGSPKVQHTEIMFEVNIYFQTISTPHPKTAKVHLLSPPVDLDLGFFLQAALQSAYLCLLQRGWETRMHIAHCWEMWAFVKIKMRSKVSPVDVSIVFRLRKGLLCHIQTVWKWQKKVMGEECKTFSFILSINFSA